MHLLTPKLLSHPNFQMVYWYCGGCDALHPIQLKTRPGLETAGWDWNDDVEKPTFSPSFGTMHSEHSDHPGYCHTIITDGVVHYLPDSTVNPEYVNIHKPLLDIPQEKLDGIMRNRS